MKINDYLMWMFNVITFKGHFILMLLCLFKLSSLYSQDSIRSTEKNKISSELASKLSGVKYALYNSTAEQIDAVVNNTQAQDLLAKVNHFLISSLHLQAAGFTETQKQEILSQPNQSLCDIVNFSFDPGTYKTSFGAIGAYKNSSLTFGFCDNTIYKVQLNNVPIDGMAYAPNRFAAALKQIVVPKFKYDPTKRLVMESLPIIAQSTEIDSMLAVPKNKYQGKYQGLGLDKNTASYTLALIDKDEKLYLVYLKGARSDWAVGEIKAELNKTASEKIYISKWFDAMKKPSDVSIIFDDDNSFTVRSKTFEDKYVRLIN